MKKIRFFKLFRGEIGLISMCLSVIRSISESDNSAFDNLKKCYDYLFSDLYPGSADFRLLCLLNDKFFNMWNNDK